MIDSDIPLPKDILLNPIQWGVDHSELDSNCSLAQSIDVTRG